MFIPIDVRANDKTAPQFRVEKGIRSFKRIDDRFRFRSDHELFSLTKWGGFAYWPALGSKFESSPNFTERMKNAGQILDTEPEVASVLNAYRAERS